MTFRLLLTLTLLLSSCAGQMCFQPSACYKLPTFSHWNCPPPGADVCQWKAHRP